MSKGLPQAGWLRDFVFKVASRCNLACDYCYVYTGPDQTWRQRPQRMSPATIEAAATRIGQHAHAHQLDSVQIALHGGEPLLAGPEVIEHLITTVLDSIPRGTRADLIVQTNGVLLDRTFLDLFARYQARIGVSLDGNREASDRHRVHADGRTSYHEASRALHLLNSEPYRHLFAGVLCTIDLENDPVETYRALLEFGPPTADFLLPHANWSHPPPRRPGLGATPYADWLLAIFDAWYDDPAAGTSIRFFDEMIQLMLGGAAGTEALGGGVPGFAVIETDGTIEGADSLKSAYHGAAATGLSVHTHSFDEALQHPVIAGPRLGRDALGTTCRSCPVVKVCGGGQFAHRYRAGAGFGNPSVYCADLNRMIQHVATRVHRDLRGAVSRQPC
jgi:uncharacterized protein